LNYLGKVLFKILKAKQDPKTKSDDPKCKIGSLEGSLIQNFLLMILTVKQAHQEASDDSNSNTRSSEDF